MVAIYGNSGIRGIGSYSGNFGNNGINGSYIVYCSIGNNGIYNDTSNTIITNATTV